MLIYPAEPFAGRVPDSAYSPELDEAQRAGLGTALLDFEALLEGDLTRALRWVSRSDAPQLAVYRGWMMRPEMYADLYAGLLNRNWRLINTPEQYRHTHLLPESFGAIAEHSPHTVWIPAATQSDMDPAAVAVAMASFGTGALIVKDYVKSRKHEWDEACFIPDASDTVAAMQVIQTFLSRQGSEFQGGLVLRAFEPFAPLTTHSQSGMPLTREYRLFFADGEVLSAAEYWEEGRYEGEPLPLEHFRRIARKIDSRFFTVDVAQRTDGVWRVMELGDGQVAGLPDRLDRPAFYAGLAKVTASDRQN